MVIVGEFFVIAPTWFHHLVEILYILWFELLNECFCNLNHNCISRQHHYDVIRNKEHYCTKSDIYQICNEIKKLRFSDYSFYRREAKGSG